MNDTTETVKVGTTTSTATTFGELADFAVASDAPPSNPAPVRTLRAAASGHVESAVYAHLRAMRSLGRTSANTAQIAKALALPLKEVDRAVQNLTHRGVKLGGR